MVEQAKKAALLGASGYTGADLLRLGVPHPHLEFVALTAHAQAGQKLAQVYPHLGRAGLPDLVMADEVAWAELDVVFCSLPHGTAHQWVSAIHAQAPHIKMIDMSADFRLRDAHLYARTYGQPHQATGLLSKAAYGLTEHNREAIKQAPIVACPGCYPTATLLALLPLIHQGHIDAYDVIIDAKSGVSGAGRGLKQNTLFCEAGESLSPYAVGSHRHAPEIEQEIGKAIGADLTVNFTPHLVPMSRGELITAHVKLSGGATVNDLNNALQTAYENEPFVHLLEEAALPGTGQVRGSNHCVINVFEDRIRGRAIVIAALDNLVKGSAGQALQNFNVMFGYDETLGLQQPAMFP